MAKWLVFSQRSKTGHPNGGSQFLSRPPLPCRNPILLSTLRQFVGMRSVVFLLISHRSRASFCRRQRHSLFLRWLLCPSLLRPPLLRGSLLQSVFPSVIAFHHDTVRLSTEVGVFPNTYHIFQRVIAPDPAQPSPNRPCKICRKFRAALRIEVSPADDFPCYERNNDAYIQESEDLKPYFHIALGGMKGRANQVCSAIGRDQLKHYDERCVKIREAMNYFWDQLDGLPGIHAIRVDESTGSNMAGWYCPHGSYKPEELHGLSVKRFAEAVRAEIGGICYDGANYCLHTHNFFKTFDLTNCGAPSRIAHNDYDVRKEDKMCDPSLEKYYFSIPRFNFLDKNVIDLYAAGYRKVVENHTDLLDNDTKEVQGGHWYGAENH